MRNKKINLENEFRRIINFFFILLPALFLQFSFLVSCQSDITSDYPLEPIEFTKVKINDKFWAPRLETNQQVTIPYAFQMGEETGRIKNFEEAALVLKGEKEHGEFHSKYPFDDSDVFKIIEGASYSLAINPDPELASYLDNLIAKIKAAQEPDGYLYTARTIKAEKPHPWIKKERWANLSISHELYNVGHLYEAAVAHYLATGKRDLLDVALKNADLIASVFGPGKRIGVPGHQEIEIGLVKLYRVTGKRKYLDLAKFFLDERGRGEKRELYGEYSQDHLPVVEQREAVGHAVRAVYMYSGMADVAALTKEKAYIEAIKEIWSDVISKKLYVTGGIGASGRIEGFGQPYELPNASAYCETCASIGNVFWNQRMFLFTGDGKYIDVLERTLYNALLSGISLEGNRFFYPNVLESFGQQERSPWFSCACCPSNITRFLPSLPGYVYAVHDDQLYLNLFIQNEAEISLKKHQVKVRQETTYPWEGQVRIILEPASPLEFTLMVRIPGWARGEAVPSDLYRFLEEKTPLPEVTINGIKLDFRKDDLTQGFLPIKRFWQAGDEVEVIFPMPIRRVIAHPRVKDDKGLIALQRGPLVYCAEAIDNGGRVTHLVLPDEVKLEAELKPDWLKGVVVLKGEAVALYAGKKEGVVEKRKQPFLAIPYYAWAHRGRGEMRVWLARQEDKARPWPQPTLASRAKVSVSGGRGVAAVNDQWKPQSSNDHSHPYLHWWPNKGTTEWVEYKWEQPVVVSQAEVYWFDDTGQGECRLPQAWRILYLAGTEWKEAQNQTTYEIAKDKYCQVTFQPVKAKALRLEIQLQKDYSAGILEWKVK